MLQGRIAWVTGGGTGIGRAGALELAAAGATIVVSGRRPEQLAAVVAEIGAAGGKAGAIALDVADKAAVARAAAAMLERHGRIDILVNSAGLNIVNRSWKKLALEDWDEVVSVNLNGAAYCIAAVLPAMRAQRDGLVINIASWAGRFVSALTGPAYTASKHAMVAMTLSLNMEECGHNIRACCINPGEVATPILKKRPVPPSAEDVARMLTAEDLARTIRFVAETPPHVCIHEILIGPTVNRFFPGSEAPRG
jgi:NADP-dependent 3-hydroxy acid dehydrogenase YdfG